LSTELVNWVQNLVIQATVMFKDVETCVPKSLKRFMLVLLIQTKSL
jgi:hypothetical protein